MSKIYKSANITIDENNRVNIKAPKPPAPAPAPVVREDKAEDINEKAENILENARNKEQSILQNAESIANMMISEAREKASKEAEEIKNAARDEGYKEGYSKGEAQANKIKREANKIKADAEKYKEDLIKSAEPEMVELILELIKKLISDEIDINPDVVLYLIRKGLKHAPVSGDINIHVSKADYPNAIENRDMIFKDIETMAKIDFVEDLSLRPAECVIETFFGSINCNLSEQFKELSKNMYFILNSHK